MDEKELQQFTQFAQAYMAFKGYSGDDINKAVQGFNTAPLLFGNTGLFTTQGLESDIITAYVRPKGLMGEIPSFESILEQPIFGSITGVQGDGAAAVNNPCDDAPSGYIKGCNISAQFGRLQFDTQEMEFDKIFLQLNSGVNTELRLRGRLLGLNDDMNPSNISEEDVLNIVIGAEMVKVGMLMERGTTNQTGLVRQVWQGAIANNSAGEGYKEFPGLDNQITTGIIDAQSGTACSALDSDVKDFNFQNIFSNNANNVPNAVWYLSTLEANLRYNAQRMGLDPVDWRIVMRAELWDELTQLWPVAYNTNRGAEILAGNTRLTLDATDMTAARDAMRAQMTIAINGRVYPVIVDDGINELTNINNANVPAGSYASSIYMVPISINGAFPVTYFENIDYRRGMSLSGVSKLMGKQDFWTDRGLFSWAIENQKWCFKLSAKTERRIVLRTPQLAGRIDNVLYSPLQHFRESFPGSPYEQDGGVSTRPASTVQAVWN